MNEVSLSRRVAFSSGHRHWIEDLSEEANKELFGRYASRFNHGHNYQLWVTASGEVESENGMVVNIKTIDEFLQNNIVKLFDQKSINDEVAEFRSLPSIENLLAWFAKTCSNLPGQVQLTHLKLEETPDFYGEWNSEPPMISLTRKYEFAASHRLHVESLSEAENVALFGKCNHIHGHGHNYELEVTVTGEPDPVTGFVCPLDELDSVVQREVVSRYDHKNLDKDIPELLGKNTTSEIVVQAIFNRLKSCVPAKLVRVRLYETARNMFEISSE